MAGLSFFRTAPRKPRPIREEHTVIDLEGRPVPLRIRHHPQARRMTLRVDPVGGGAILTLPVSTPAEAGLDMVRRKAGWLIGRLEALRRGRSSPTAPRSPCWARNWSSATSPKAAAWCAARAAR
jgi:hypothetical protein